MNILRCLALTDTVDCLYVATNFSRTAKKTKPNMQSLGRVLRTAGGRCAARGWVEAARQARAAFGTGGGAGAGARGAAWRAPGGRALLCSGVAAVGSACAVLASPARAESIDDLDDEPSIIDRAVGMLGLSAWFTWTREPADRGGCPPGKLLPDPTDLPPGVIQRTLVLSLEDTLVHTEWERKFGHRTRKRPGLDAFLAHMSQFYEIVIFTSAQSSYGQTITEAMRDNPAVCLPSLPVCCSEWAIWSPLTISTCPPMSTLPRRNSAHRRLSSCSETVVGAGRVFSTCPLPRAHSGQQGEGPVILKQGPAARHHRRHQPQQLRAAEI